jgi:hypothetical protein
MIAAPLLATLALPAAPQDPAEEQEWLPLNRVDLIVNEECVTTEDIRGKVRQRVRRLGLDMSTPEERAQLIQEVTTDEISNYLKVGAGRDRGFEPEMIQRIVQGEHRSQKERAQSAASLADYWRADGIDSGQYFTNLEESVLALLWTRSVVGLFPGPGGRPYVDRFVRPGRLKYEFERQKSNLALPTLITLQQAQSRPREQGELDNCRTVAEEFHRRIQAGEDFGDVAVELRLAPEDTKGVEGPYELDLLLQIQGLDEFFPTAEIDDVSGVLPMRESGTLKGFRVVKLVTREEQRAASFVDAEFQRVLTESVQKSLDQGREDVALGELLRAAYVWPPEAFGRARARR